MENAQYAEANVLLFDQKRAVRVQTRSILNTLGFKKFIEFHDLMEARGALSNQRLDLIILSIETTDCGVLQLVDDIRRQRCGLDPFIPILLTAWDCELNVLQPVVESGADDVLLHPFSTAQMGERVDILVRNRKPFVVTEDYLGPDRRTNAEIGKGPPPIIVPNALQARVQGVAEAGPTAARIEETLSELRLLKLRNMARHIWHLANSLKQAGQDPSLPERFDRELAKLGKSIRLYRKALTDGDAADLHSLSKSLLGVVSKQLGRLPSERGLALLEQSSLALRVASRLEHDRNVTCEAASAAISQEISKVSEVQEDLIRAVLG